jgi:hypothetical protein
VRIDWWEKSGYAVAMYVLAGGIGLSLWFAIIDLGLHPYLGWFLLTSTVSAAALVLIAGCNPLTVLPMAIGPNTIAFWTAPRGDNDGLWLYILPELFAWDGILFAIAFGLAALRRTLWHPNDVRSRRRAKSATVAIWVAATISVTTAISLLADLLAGPWSDLQSALGTYPVPASYTVVGTQREGSALCEDSCNARLSLLLNSSNSESSDCDILGLSLERWPGVDDVHPLPLISIPGVWETCSYEATQYHGGILRSVLATISRPPNQRPLVKISIIDPGYPVS